MKKILIVLMLVLPLIAKADKQDVFFDSEKNFKLSMQKLMDNYVDKNIGKDELYKAATAGMFAYLNSNNENWNKLLSPSDLQEMQMDMTGKVTGIGIEMNFNQETGHAQILRVIAQSAAEKAGLKVSDQILSVNGKNFKNKKLHDLVYAVRGKTQEIVILKVLRDDKMLSFNIKREFVSWTPVELEQIDKSKAVLSIRFFNQETPKLVEQKINEIKANRYKKVILDLRGNSGGGFDQAIQAMQLFFPSGSIIAKTKNRDGQIDGHYSKSYLWDSSIQIVVLTNKDTFCAAELFVAALRENLKVKTIGEATFGKWSIQSVEALPNRYAIKYTVKELLSPMGNSFQSTGVRPDIEVSLPQGTVPYELRLKYGMKDRLNFDTQLRAAIQLLNS